MPAGHEWRRIAKVARRGSMRTAGRPARSRRQPRSADLPTVPRAAWPIDPFDVLQIVTALVCLAYSLRGGGMLLPWLPPAGVLVRFLLSADYRQRVTVW